jgi:UDP-2-acetamido-3-amino-2,3-dideoxy-glucuronate N-acetyltransferase
MEIKTKNIQMIDFRIGPLNKETGSLCFFEVGKEIPFEIKRAFCVFDTTESAERGHHAHKESWQIHIVMDGKATITVDDGVHTQKIVLDSPTKGLLVGPEVWHSFVLEKNCSLFVLSSNYYDEKDYIRSYDDFIRIIKEK